jgi:UDP-N-acetylglucosamine 2-epimerase (non-hydrolysing)
VRIVYPVHPNPNVVEPAREVLSDHPRIALTEPLDYFDLVTALQRARLILTDSGGIQEEAPTFGTPVLVLRRVTERPEGVEAGIAELVGTDRLRIVRRSLDVLARNPPREGRPNPYGDGRAGERIADILVASLCGERRRTQDWTP